MTNAYLFREIFGLYAEEFWSLPIDKMTAWLDSDVDIALIEFCDKLRKEGYQRGHADGRGDRKCEGCNYAPVPFTSYPCCRCSRRYLDYYVNKKGDSNG